MPGRVAHLSASFHEGLGASWYHTVQSAGRSLVRLCNSAVWFQRTRGHVCPLNLVCEEV